MLPLFLSLWIKFPEGETDDEVRTVVDDAEEETALLASVVTEITDKDVAAATDCSLIL